MTYNPDDFENQLRQMVKACCSYEKGSLLRQQELTKIICLILGSPKLWRGGGGVSLDLYEEASQKTCFYFCRHLCDLNNREKAKVFRIFGTLMRQKADFLVVFIYTYLLRRASPLTWFNNRLKWTIADLQKEVQIEKMKRAFPQIDPQTGAVTDPIDILTAPSVNTHSMIDEIKQWLDSDKRRLERIHLRDRPEINSYVVISFAITRHMLEGEPWTTLAQKLSEPQKTLTEKTLTSFYQRRCLPLLKKWGESQGYLDD